MEETNKTIDVSIIIVNYNTERFTFDAISSIKSKTTDLNYEVIVVDNNSNDTLKSLRPMKCVTIIRLDTNYGFGYANNEGLKIAQGRNVLFLNPDTLLINNAIKILCTYLDQNSEVGAAGGNLFSENNTPTHSYAMVMPGVKHELDLLFGGLIENIEFGQNREFNHTDKPRQVAFITGADLMMSRALALRLNGFDSQFFMYYEDAELCQRIKKSGHLIINIPCAHIKHLEGRSFGNIPLSRFERLIKGRKLFYEKTQSKGAKWGADILFNIFLILKIVIAIPCRSKRINAVQSFVIFNRYK